ncbi:MAG: hypothetical protein H0T46_12305 [Deltaproteobacteria bacterium]|nr:hypothetical protein [Deltaproteobacteria bacterium]
MSSRLWIACIASLALGGAANAQPKKESPPPPPPVSCEFMEISASSGAAASMDADLEKLKKKLKKPPFSSWNQFKLLMKADKALTRKRVETIQLKMGKAEATLLGIVNGSQVRLSISIDDAAGKNFVNNTSTFAAGDYLVYGHSLPNNDGHLLALTCK